MALARILPHDFEIVLADIGSAGGIHQRWKSFSRNLRCLLFDPFDTGGRGPGDRVFPFALGDAAGRAALNVTRRGSMTSLLEPDAAEFARFWFKPAHVEVIERLPVAVEPLDRLVERHGLRVDVMKIDTQGYESRIISGAQRTLAGQTMLCEIEVSFFERYRGLVPVAGIIAAMADLGFELIELSRAKRYYARNRSGIVKPGSGMGNRPGRLAFCDALFLKREDALDALIRAQYEENGRHAALRALVALAAYGKFDMAAALVDRHAALFAQPLRRQLDAWRGSLRRWQGLSKLPHLLLDYLARRV